MAAFSFVGLAVTSATVVIYGAPVVDPVQLLGRMESPVAICVSLFGGCSCWSRSQPSAGVCVCRLVGAADLAAWSPQ
jgi:cytosine/uracil/thiamine/allantoin permease